MSPTHNNAAPKLNAWEQKIGGPPRSYRVNVNFSKNIIALYRNNH